MPTDATLKKVRLSVSNAVHSLAVLVAHDEGLFRDQGLDVEIVRTPGSAHVDTDRHAVQDAIFERPLESFASLGEVQRMVAPACPTPGDNTAPPSPGHFRREPRQEHARPRCTGRSSSSLPGH